MWIIQWLGHAKVCFSLFKFAIGCGDGWTKCNLKTGCEVCNGLADENTYESNLATHPAGLSSTFTQWHSENSWFKWLI